MYYAGLGTAADKPKALKYLIESAEQGNTQAKAYRCTGAYKRRIHSTGYSTWNNYAN